MENSVDKLVGKTDEIGFKPIKSKGAYSSKKVWINSLCNSLNRDTATYDPNKTMSSLKAYITKEERLLYSEVSNYIFTLDNDALGKFMTNLDRLVEHYEESKMDDIKISRAIMKLYDHSQLALSQTRNLVKDDSDFQKMIEKKLGPVYDQFNDMVDNAKRDISAQLISLIGIFTALSFLIFGGINSLDNIFSGLTTLPILKLMVIGCIWGLCVLNLIFVFMYFVAKITGVNIKTNHKPTANFIQRYPYWIWSNLLIATILLICAWLYFIDEQNIGNWFIMLSKSRQAFISLLGFSIIGAFFVVISLYIINKCKEE